MSAIARLRTAVEMHGLHEIDASYPDALREYRANIREAWLRQEINRIVRRINVIRAMQVFERENDWHPAVFRREIYRNNRLLKEHRNELEKLRSEHA